MKKNASIGRIPAVAYVKTLEKVTCGFTNMVLDVESKNPPISKPITKDVSFELLLERPYTTITKEEGSEELETVTTARSSYC
ncbi:MAG: hypothetical protein ACUVTL_08400 [Thermoproteota archaeon]